MPGGPPIRQRTSSTTGGALPVSSAARDRASTRGPAERLAPIVGDNLSVSVDKPRRSGGFPPPGCGQTRGPAGIRPESGRVFPQPVQHLGGVPVRREHRGEDVFGSALV